MHSSASRLLLSIFSVGGRALTVLLTKLNILLVAHLFKTLRIRCSNEVCLHVINATSRSHQVLIVLAFDLNHAHDDTINHVHGLSLLVLTLLTLELLIPVVVFDPLSEVILHVQVTFVVDAILLSTLVLIVCLKVSELVVGLINA